MQNEVTMEQNPVVDKSFKFAVRIVNLYKHMIREHKEYVLSKHILRCGTSIGAIIAEAQRGQSKADFAAKMNVALKEASETAYWLRLLHKTDYLSKEQYSSLYTDIHELISLLMAIYRTANDTK